VNLIDGFFYIGRVKANQRILADLGATDRFGFDFFDGAFRVLLRKSYS